MAKQSLICAIYFIFHHSSLYFAAWYRRLLWNFPNVCWFKAIRPKGLKEREWQAKTTRSNGNESALVCAGSIAKCSSYIWMQFGARFVYHIRNWQIGKGTLFRRDCIQFVVCNISVIVVGFYFFFFTSLYRLHINGYMANDNYMDLWDMSFLHSSISIWWTNRNEWIEWWMNILTKRRKKNQHK